MLDLQQKIRSKKKGVFAEEDNNIIFSANNSRRTQSIESIDTYSYRMSKYLVCKKEEIKHNNVVKIQK